MREELAVETVLCTVSGAKRLENTNSKAGFPFSDGYVDKLSYQVT